MLHACLSPAAPPSHIRLQEFDPWLKWLIFDAAFTLLVGAVARQFESLQPWFAAVGWL
jgi:hypothetical protein